jgi:formylglycine-generating enzyme required for sulfatase activity
MRMHQTNVAPEFDVFVSYNSLDHAAVERIARALKDRDLTVFLDRWELVPGRPWPNALEELLSKCAAAAVVLGPSGMGAWQQREHYLALDRQASNPEFGVIPVILPNAEPALGFLSLNTWVDLRGGVDDAQSIDLLAAAVRGEPPSALLERTRQAVAEICPYRGLEVFREEDAPFFFGREAFTEKLCETVSAQSLIAVVGSSGSGKSSVVRAGLIPRLRRPDGPVWEMVTLVPGKQPLEALAGALLPLLEPEMTEPDRLAEMNKQADYLRTGQVRLHQVIKRMVEKQTGTDRLLLVVDQWEELYTYAKNKEAEKVNARFVDQLLAATESAPLTVVLTLRADFYGEALAHRGLSDRLQGAQVNLGPMTRDELEHVITAPAEKVGLSFDTGLVDRLLDDVGEEPGNLPLLEFALKGLWKARKENRLLYEVYKDMGGVKRAIARLAETVYAKLDPAEKKAAEQVFTKLVRPGDETGDTRLRTGLGEFNVAGQALIRKLAGPEVRLLITGQDATTGEKSVDVAHEALIREWDRLRGWVNKVRKQLNDRRLLLDMAEKWRDRGRPKFSGLASIGQLWGFWSAGAPSKLARNYLVASALGVSLRWGIMLTLLGTVGYYLWWSDNQGLSAKKGAELLLYRIGTYQPMWIPEMVNIAPRSFQVGSPGPKAPHYDGYADSSEFPQHPVTIEKEFKIGKYEVTFEQYCASTKSPCPNPQWGRGRQPVINVTWDDANTYAKWLTKITGLEYRLPTEAEWEYAARGGTEGRYWWCDEAKPNCDIKPDIANCSACESTLGLERIGKQALEVGSFPENPFELYDTAGNVSEWVQDCYHDNYEGAPKDGLAWEPSTGECRRRVVRGGSWRQRAAVPPFRGARRGRPWQRGRRRWFSSCPGSLTLCSFFFYPLRGSRGLAPWSRASRANERIGNLKACV